MTAACDPYDVQADALPTELLGRIDRFWASFARKADALDAFFTTQGAEGAADPVEVMAELSLDERTVSLFEIKDAQDDHPRADLITFLASPERYGLAAINAVRFSSPCYSSHGEWFIYLRVPNTDDGPLRVDDRGEIEEIIHTLLAREGLGGVVAGGAGAEASYIDIALRDVAQGLARLAQELRAHPYAAQTTFHFLDPGLTETAHPLLGAAASVQ